MTKEKIFDAMTMGKYFGIIDIVSSGIIKSNLRRKANKIERLTITTSVEKKIILFLCFIIKYYLINIFII